MYPRTWPTELVSLGRWGLIDLLDMTQTEGAGVRSQWARSYPSLSRPLFLTCGMGPSHLIHSRQGCQVQGPASSMPEACLSSCLPRGCWLLKRILEPTNKNKWYPLSGSKRWTMLQTFLGRSLVLWEMVTSCCCDKTPEKKSACLFSHTGPRATGSLVWGCSDYTVLET